MEQTTRRFNTRAFVALVTAFSALGLPVTGLANHWLGFAPLTVTRHAWMSAHNILGLLVVVFGSWHAVLNRGALAHHLARAAGRLPRLTREAVLAGGLVTLVVLLFVGHAFHAGGPR